MQSVLGLVVMGEREQEGSQARSHMHQEGCGGGGFEQGRCEKSVERPGVTLGWQKAPSRCPRTTPMRILTVRATLTNTPLGFRSQLCCGHTKALARVARPQLQS